MVRPVRRFHPSPRDVLLIALGAFAMHIVSVLFSSSDYLVLNTHVDFSGYDPRTAVTTSLVANDTGTEIVLGHADGSAHELVVIPPTQLVDEFPKTTVLRHAPGWTMFENIYMANGTLFIVSDEGSSAFPGVFSLRPSRDPKA